MKCVARDLVLSRGDADVWPKFVAILEDHLGRATAMRKVLADVLPRFNVLVFDEAPTMRDWLELNLADVVLISLDHDLPPRGGTGRDLADFLSVRPCVCPVIVHTSNVQAAPGMMRVLREAGWVCSFVTPRDDLAWVDSEWRAEVEQYARRGWIFG